MFVFASPPWQVKMNLYLNIWNIRCHTNERPYHKLERYRGRTAVRPAGNASRTEKRRRHIHEAPLSIFQDSCFRARLHCMKLYEFATYSCGDNSKSRDRALRECSYTRDPQTSCWTVWSKQTLDQFISQASIGAPKLRISANLRIRGIL